MTQALRATVCGRTQWGEGFPKARMAHLQPTEDNEILKQLLQYNDFPKIQYYMNLDALARLCKYSIEMALHY